ncbi:hypothetical protein EXVG_00010 [Emiliania huxleyi virus 202]|nr:hypothetical protein EXVG_00010 [Emiliania huxleyi virus 202]AHA54544.1 hypothetical protein EhV18_00498 [Emiliania huxleyi virus 18]AHA55583.1 hypothetical protein EhV156_00488 [Emiliania huxleyi virus 156]
MDKLINDVKIGKADIDCLIDKIMTEHPTEEMQDGASHVMWIRRETAKLLRSQVELADKEATLDAREKAIVARERALR